MPSRRPWYVAALLTGLGGLFLLLAAAVRWWPCLSDDDSAACVTRQSHAFDYLVPTEPAQTLPATAVLAGLGLLLVAAAWPVLAGQLRVRPPRRALIAVVMTVKPLLLGMLVLAAPAAGVLPRSASPVLLVTGIALDLAALAVVLAVPSDRLADFRRLLVATVAYWLVGYVGLVLDALVFGLLDPAAEVAPGAGLLTGVLVLVCGAGLAGLTATAAERTSPSGGAGNALERPAHR